MFEVYFGGPVSGARRFSRPSEEQRFLRLLEGSAGIRMFGLRRIGKSTFRLIAVEHFEAQKATVIQVDGQGLYSLAEFLRCLAAALPLGTTIFARAMGALGQGPARAALDAITKNESAEAAVVSAYWQVVSDALRKAIAENARIILVFDEFSYFIDNLAKGANGRQDADRLLASFREWRDVGLKMVLLGSIGLASIARRYDLNIEHMNDLQRFAPSELSPEEAKQFVADATVKSNGAWTAAHIDRFLEECRVLYPCFLARGLIEIGVSGSPPPPDAFGDIFANRIRPDLHKDFFDQFDRRIKSYRAASAALHDECALPLLKAIAAAGARGVAQEALQPEKATPADVSATLDMLADDGFLTFSENADGDRFWRFSSRIVSLWWRQARLS